VECYESKSNIITQYFVNFTKTTLNYTTLQRKLIVKHRSKQNIKKSKTRPAVEIVKQTLHRKSYIFTALHGRSQPAPT